MLKVSGTIFLVVFFVFGYMMFQGQMPPEQTLMDIQEVPPEGANVSACEKNSDCIAIREYCCDCDQGGKRIAINRKYYKHQLDYRADTCILVSCQAAQSLDRSCDGGKPTCDNGQCKML